MSLEVPGNIPVAEPVGTNDHVKICISDWDGVLRGKYLRKGKLPDAFRGHGKFSEVLFGWDSADTLIETDSFLGLTTGFPDDAIRVVEDTCRSIPFEGGTELYLAEFAGRARGVCPRRVLQRVLDRARDLGFGVQASVEFEFFLFAESPETCRRKSYHNLNTITPGAFGYSMLRAGANASFFAELLSVCEAMRMPIEGLHTESGPGAIEAALCHSEALEAADRAILFKTITKTLAYRRNWMATFMAKWSHQLPGQSGHLHISLTRDGKGCFFDSSETDRISRTMRQFIAGQIAFLPDVMAMVAPTVNSYKRLVPGMWAPTTASWGVDNRTCAVRAILASESAQRIEYRISGADINPYLALAAAIGTGIYGIESHMNPPLPTVGNAYEQSSRVEVKLPASLGDAAQHLRRSEVAQRLFGEEFVRYFAASRTWEHTQIHGKISDAEFDRYFEII